MSRSSGLASVVRIALPLAVVAGLVRTAPPAWATGLEYRVAVIDRFQEVPPTTSTAFGCARFEIDVCNNQLFYYIVFTGLSTPETGAHIHGPAAPGVNAGVKHLLPAGNPKVGVWNYAQADEADILAGRMYVNIHSTAFPGGEIRGQIVTHVAYLDGAQEVPANGSTGLGYALGNVDTDTNTLSYYIVFGGLSTAETAAHIHGLAEHGVNAGVKHPLPLGSPKVGVWNYAEADEAGILDGMIYVNVHSTMFPGGEIRGQFVPYVVPMDGTQEVPPNASPAAGCGLLSLNRGGDVLGYDFRYANLSAAETGAHIHGFAPPGANAGVLHVMAAGTRKLGSWAYAAAQESGILDSMTYANVHSVVFGGGELRGQLYFPAPACPADLDKDGMIGLSDLSIMLTNFGGAGGPCDGDLDGNGTVDLADLSELLTAFGLACP